MIASVCASVRNTATGERSRAQHCPRKETKEQTQHTSVARREREAPNHPTKALERKEREMGMGSGP